MAPTKDDYLLSRSYAASGRLNLQHYLWRSGSNNNLLHASISIDGAKGLKVADVGTGTGIWLSDLHATYPSETFAALDGLDISLDQVPPQQWLPANMQFRVFDIYDEDPPHDLMGTYDIVHVRHLSLVVKNNDPSPVLKNLLKLVKPGGYIQWSEFNLPSRKLVTVSDSDPTIKALTEEVDKLFVFMNKFVHTPFHSWPAELPTYFKSHGLQNVVDEVKWYDQQYLYATMDSSLMATEEMIDGFAAQGKISDEDIQTMRHGLGKCAEAKKNGMAWNLMRLTSVGQKSP